MIDFKKVVYGAKSDASARYLDPTILYPISWSDKIMEDEIFGPLLPILTYSELGKLLAKVKSLPKALAGYVFSRNQATIDRVLQLLSFGGGAVNQTNVFLFIESMPYGGVGTSGIGNYYGKYGYDSLTHAKSVLISPPDVVIEHLFRPTRPKRYRSSINGSSTERPLDRTHWRMEMILAGIEVVDTPLVHDAIELARNCSEPYLFNHSMRSWLFGVLVAEGAEPAPDPVLLAVSAIRHDRGLTDRYSAQERFEVDGASAARSFLTERGIPAHQIQLVWDAIALHTTRSIALHKEPEVAMTHSGIAVDVIGAGT